LKIEKKISLSKPATTTKIKIKIKKIIKYFFIFFASVRTAEGSGEGGRGGRGGEGGRGEGREMRPCGRGFYRIGRQ
jgi:hypothetical protein